MSGADCTKRCCTRLDDVGLIDVTRVVLDTAHVRAKRGRTHRSGPLGPGQAGFQHGHPVGRERTAPLVGVSAGNTHHSEGLKLMIERHIGVRIARKGIESSERLLTLNA